MEEKRIIRKGKSKKRANNEEKDKTSSLCLWSKSVNGFSFNKYVRIEVMLIPTALFE
jgi:hypothetical protein